MTFFVSCKTYIAKIIDRQILAYKLIWANFFVKILSDERAMLCTPSHLSFFSDWVGGPSIGEYLHTHGKSLVLYEHDCFLILGELCI